MGCWGFPPGRAASGPGQRWIAAFLQAGRSPAHFLLEKPSERLPSARCWAGNQDTMMHEARPCPQELSGCHRHDARADGKGRRRRRGAREGGAFGAWAPQCHSGNGKQSPGAGPLREGGIRPAERERVAKWWAWGARAMRREVGAHLVRISGSGSRAGRRDWGRGGQGVRGPGHAAWGTG